LKKLLQTSVDDYREDLKYGVSLPLISLHIHHWWNVNENWFSIDMSLDCYRTWK